MSNIKEKVQDIKRELTLEKDILQEIVRKELLRFQEQTGLSVKSISLYFFHETGKELPVDYTVEIRTDIEY